MAIQPATGSTLKIAHGHRNCVAVAENSVAACVAFPLHREAEALEFALRRAAETPYILESTAFFSSLQWQNLAVPSQASAVFDPTLRRATLCRALTGER